MKAGMTFTIEPMLTEGEPETFMWSDNWTIATT
jgi:methionine aminopeptidase